MGHSNKTWAKTNQSKFFKKLTAVKSYRATGHTLQDILSDKGIIFDKLEEIIYPQ